MRFEVDVIENHPDDTEDEWSFALKQRELIQVVETLLHKLARGVDSSVVITIAKEHKP